MAMFNLNDYETVEERIKRFYEAHKDGRIITENVTTEQDRNAKTWVVKSFIYLSAGDQAAELPKATGYAFEIDGGGGANKTSALENAETSAIGRALANMALSGNKRASREEMAKVQRAEGKNDWLLEASKLTTVEDLRKLYAKANVSKADKATLDEIKRRADELTTSKPQGTGGGVSGSAKK